MTKQPTIEPGQVATEANYTNLLTKKRGFSAGADCVTKRIAIRIPALLQNRDYYQGCWYNTKLGLLEKEGRYLLQPDAKAAGRILGGVNNTSRLVPTPNPDIFLELVDDAAAGSGNYVYFRPLNNTKLTQTIGPTGFVMLTLKEAPKAELKSASSRTHVDSEDVWYSDNAKWMLVYGQRGAVIRINLETFQVLNIYIRDKPKGLLRGMAAIADDGRHIALAITEPGMREVFMTDTYTCSNKESLLVTSPTTCQVRSLKLLLQNFINPSDNIVLPMFYGNDALGVYRVNGTLPVNYTQYILYAPNTTMSKWNYIALGDSFSSGEGAFEYEPGTDVEDNKCHLSRKSYPYLISKEVNLTSFHSVACSGAKINDVLNATQKLDASKKYPKENWISGTKPQLQYFIDNSVNPDIITISVSGNDIGFSNRIKTCIFDPDCYQTYEDRKEITQEIIKHTARLADALEDVREAAAPNAKVYVLGYPQILSSDSKATCGANVQLSASQRAMAADMISYFNSAIKVAAVRSGTQYVGVEGSLIGHRLCETSWSKIAVNGVTTGNDSGVKSVKVIGSGSFHPNQLGHKLMKDAVLRHSLNFTRQMPTPKEAPWPDAENHPFLIDIPKTGRASRKLYNVSNDTLSIGYTLQRIKASIRTTSAPTTSNAIYKVELRSKPVSLGQVQSDGAGNIEADFHIPAGIEPGLHTLHFIGPDSEGKTIDIYQYIYIGVSELDFDGDGVPNSEEPCGAISPSNQDADRDNIDDACDPLIDEALPPLNDINLPGQGTGSDPTTNTPVDRELPHINFRSTQQNLAIQFTNFGTGLPGMTYSAGSGALQPTSRKVLSEQSVIKSPKSVTKDKGIPARQSLRLWITGAIVLTFFAILLYAMFRHGKKTNK